MQLSRLFAATFVVSIASVATIVSCGGDDGGSGTPDAKHVDAAHHDTSSGSDAAIDTPSGVNALGQLCPAASGGSGTACPTGNDCVSITGLGSTTTGYCTPDCGGDDTVCSTGYTGPSGGMEVCALTTGSGSDATGCAIICTAATQCPTGMECDVAQGTTKICVPM
ncbi:MAG TPA: hypothetical protein VGM88_09525 [Kofleriaceae bacterium]|jgi:hypothetical protein